ncbi:hypothetical protein [Legionella sp. km772]|uniref:hypothetical protein n=1 Tax=Legionella sp. km772 TaxID=2498111 RepID=UPI000F8D41B2|nr:hypothetical protein [Legionella sp. km772]RUR06985.1 hypothetical protein ELY15_12675 [Legionella sp. km772]
MQISKNTITLYFYGDDSKQISAALNAWHHLDDHFLSSMPHYNPDWIRGPDAPHIKRNHTHSGETETSHFHREFTSEVTPELLAAYLNKFWQQQNASEHDAAVFKFFQEGEVEDILEKFVSYYKEFKGSSVEALWEEGSRLTESEAESYEKAVQAEKFEKELSKLYLLSMFARRPVSLASAMTSSLDSDNEESCRIM